MPATTATSTADLIQLFRDECGLPSVNDEFPASTGDAKICQYLTLAQEACFRMLATMAPGSQVGPPELMTTDDGGYTYTTASYPFGQVEVRESRAGALLLPGAEYSPSTDFVQEGQTIRWPDNQSRTFGDGPYARYSPSPGPIFEAGEEDEEGEGEPTLRPEQARVLIAYKALDMWASKGGYRDPSPYQRQFKTLAWGDPEIPGDPGILGALRRQYRFQGGSRTTSTTSDRALWASGANLNF